MAENAEQLHDGRKCQIARFLRRKKRKNEAAHEEVVAHTLGGFWGRGDCHVPVRCRGPMTPATATAKMDTNEDNSHGKIVSIQKN